MKLISMTDFVLEHPATTDYEWQLSKHLKYANFLKQPLTLGMFVPCDLEGNLLEEPKQWIGALEFAVGEDYEEAERYQQAKERVLFEGFSIFRGEDTSEFTLFLVIDEESIAYKKDWEEYWNFDYTYIDQLNLIESDITLTQSAIKKLGL